MNMRFSWLALLLFYLLGAFIPNVCVAASNTQFLSAYRPDETGSTYALLDGLSSRSEKRRSQKFPLSTGEWQLSLARRGNVGQGRFVMRIFDSQGAKVLESNLILAPNETRNISLASIISKNLSRALVELQASSDERYQADLQLFSGDPRKQKSLILAVEPFRQGRASLQGTFISNNQSITNIFLANSSLQTARAIISLVDQTGAQLLSQTITLLPRAQVQISPSLGSEPFALVRVEALQDAQLVMSTASRFRNKKSVLAGIQRQATVATTGFAANVFDTSIGSENLLRLANVAPHQATVRLTAFDGQGTVLGNTVFELAAFRTVQLNLLAIDGLGIFSGLRGRLAIESFGSGQILGEIERNSISRERKNVSRLIANATQFIDLAEVTIPSPTPGPCQARSGFDLAACLNDLIERKGNRDQSLRINIAAGTYVLSNSVLIYQRENLEIRGALDAEGRRLTKIVLDNRLEELKRTNLLDYFTFNIVDSRNVAVADLVLDGNFNGASVDSSLRGSTTDLLTAQRGITVCPTANNLLQGITLDNLELLGFSNYNVLIGNVFGDTNIPTWLRQAPKLTLSAGEERLYRYFQNSPQGMLCGGSVSDVRFTRNTVRMRNVGFYVAPYAQLQTRSVTLSAPNFQLESPTSLRNIERGNAALQRNYFVANNLFIVDNSLPPRGEQALHSAIKVHHSEGMIIRDNIFDGGPLKQTFAGGSVINLAAGMIDAQVIGNTIALPQGHRYSFHGIAIDTGYQTHSLYGVGLQAIFGGSANIRIEKNILNNSKIYVFDCCSEDARAYCQDADSAATHDGEPFEFILEQNSEIAQSSQAQESLLYILSKEDAAFVRNHPTVSCRKNLNFLYSSAVR